ncbi:hypothetical protein QVD17_29031 [Tagetes erecta]|uniref:Uncharacterized protein n=1 Tax=Tagetes erecta TaxID=13708 RepID=A0AAD8KDS2_TARER|nr:hypothetical protein QVD17_29031 [Tagetes erecta]
MKPVSRTGLIMPTEKEVEVMETLLDLPRLIERRELISGYSFKWGKKKKRSVLELKPELLFQSPEKLPENVIKVDEKMEDRKSPSTPLCFLPCVGGGSDGGGDRKPPSSSPERMTVKRKATDDLVEVCDRIEQENQILLKKIEAMKTLHQDLISENLELKATRQKISFSRNMEDCHKWNSSMKVVDEQHHYHQQITMFAPSTSQQPPQQQQLVVDHNSGKVMAVSSDGGRFGMFNQIDPRVKIQGEAYDFMAASQPLDQSKYLKMDNDLRVRAAAAAARKRRILKMKENKNSSLAMKLTRGCSL